MIDSRFILIDLRCQWDALVDYADGWDLHELLFWLTQYGEVIPLTLEWSSGYAFRSESGISASIWWKDDERNILAPAFPEGRPLRISTTKE
jgi:hypothetical protein